jgi:single-stranded-DNA-specific exonuclease
MAKAWRTAQADSAQVQLGDQALKLHPIASRLLARRGFLTPEEITDFLNPSWEKGVHDPFLFVHMREAVERVLSAITKGEHIVIHGDYDADGVCGSSVLAETIKLLARSSPPSGGGVRGGVGDKTKFFPVLTRERDGLDLDIYIPHREKEGYGLNLESLDLIVQSGASLLITVDCGIANAAEIARARKAGMDAIVVDHHQFSDELPDAILIHPKLPGETYPFKDLAAVGVAWKFACALLAGGRERGWAVPVGWEKWLLDLVAIATITDIVPLVGENRVLEKYGLVVLNHLRRPGLKALVDSACWKRGDLDSEAIGFVLGPRINAAGRMEHAYLAVSLLLEEDPAEAARKAVELEAVNRGRQKATENMMQQAVKIMESHEKQSLIFAWSEEWSPSLVGLAAGKYADAWGKPAVFVGKYGGVWIGSGRSIPDYDITAAIKEVGQGLLTRHGGHKQACGFSLATDEHVLEFAQALRAHAAGCLVLEDLKPFLQVESELDIDLVDWRLIETLKLFEPYGERNPRPIFIANGLTVLNVNFVGAAQNHIRCVLQAASGRSQKFIGFYRKDLAEVITPGASVDIAYEVGSTEWNGQREIQCKIIDAKITDNV